MSFYTARRARDDHLDALRHRRDRTARRNGAGLVCVVDIFPLLCALLRHCVPTHHPARSGNSRGPRRRERACRSRGSHHASARLHLWCGRGGRGGTNPKRRRGEEEENVGRARRAPRFFFPPSTSRTTTSTSVSSFVPSPPPPAPESENENRRCIS